jgi:hypothetical protein
MSYDYIFKIHPEVYAAITILVPSAISVNQLRKYPILAVRFASIGTFVHCPWSVALHLYRAYGTDPIRRAFFYKMDVGFIHVQTLFHTFSWYAYLPPPIFLYHVLVLGYLIHIDTIQYPDTKRNMDILSSIGIGLGTYRYFVYYPRTCLLCAVFWLTGLVIHRYKPYGDYSAAIFHLTLGPPQYFMLKALAGHFEGKALN